MFQYAAGRALSLRLGCDLALDLSWFEGRRDRHYALAPFEIHCQIRSSGRWLPQVFQKYATRLSRRWAPVRMGVPVFREPHFHFSSTYEALVSAVFLEGYWQSEKYFETFKVALRNDFNLKGEVPSSCVNLLSMIRSSEAICVHVRRGDYLTNPVSARTHGICSVEYYQRAVQTLIHDLKQPHCFIFSDDPAWARCHLIFDCRTTVVDTNSTTDVHWDLFLMMACKHFVIANSSLSWWGAWLASAPGKKVIAPDRWFLDPRKRTHDLIPLDWRRL